MLDQIFRAQIPNTLMFDLLDQICLKTDKYYFVDINAYKKMIYANLHKPFIENVKPYYHLAKQKYLEREMTYASFTNIIRQICKHGDIGITSEIKYNRSQHYTNFFIIIPDSDGGIKLLDVSK